MLKLPKTLLAIFALGSLVLNGSVQADEPVVTLKLAHFLPAHSVTQAQFLKPWAECGFHADSDTHSTHIRTVIPR